MNTTLGRIRRRHRCILSNILFVVVTLFLMSSSTDSLATNTNGGNGGGNGAGAGTASSANAAGGQQGSEQTDGPKLLPPPTGDDPSIPTIRLGETIRFEEYGPIILNSDGTTRRISNWDQLTEAEKQTTWRRISKRNEERRKILLEQQQQQPPVDETSQGQDEL